MNVTEKVTIHRANVWTLLSSADSLNLKITRDFKNSNSATIQAKYTG